MRSDARKDNKGIITSKTKENAAERKTDRKMIDPITDIQTQEEQKGIDALNAFIVYNNTGKRDYINNIKIRKVDKEYYAKRARMYVQANETMRNAKQPAERFAAAYKMQVIEQEFITDWKDKRNDQEQ